MELSEDDIKEIKSVVRAAITETNDRYVRTDFCDERSGGIKNALYGLYALTGVLLVTMAAQLLSKL